MSWRHALYLRNAWRFLNRLKTGKGSLSDLNIQVILPSMKDTSTQHAPLSRRAWPFTGRWEIQGTLSRRFPIWQGSRLFRAILQRQALFIERAWLQPERYTISASAPSPWKVWRASLRPGENSAGLHDSGVLRKLCATRWELLFLWSIVPSMSGQLQPPVPPLERKLLQPPGPRDAR